MRWALVAVLGTVLGLWVFGVLIPDLREKRERKERARAEEASSPYPDFFWNDPVDALRDESGEIETTKFDDLDLPEVLKEEYQKFASEADVDSNGALDASELATFKRLRKIASRDRFLERLRSDDGRCDLDKLGDAWTPPEISNPLNAADLDGDGFLDPDEELAAKEALLVAEIPELFWNPPLGGFKASASPVWSDPIDRLRREDGAIELARIDALETPEEIKTRLRTELADADADSNGLLDDEEEAALTRIRRRLFRDGVFEGLRNNEGRRELAKLNGGPISESVKKAVREADANGNGFLDDEELSTARDAFDAAAEQEERARNPVDSQVGNPFPTNFVESEN